MKARLKYTGIRVKNLHDSIQFYTKVLGLTARPPDPLDQTKGISVDLVGEGSGPYIELNFYEKGSPFDTGYAAGEELDHLGFVVPDLEKAIAEATQAGYPVIQEIKVATGRWVYIRDPNGIWIELSTG